MSDIKQARLPGVLKSRVSGGVSTFEKVETRVETDARLGRDFLGRQKSIKVSFFVSKNDVSYDFWPRIVKSVVFRFKKRRFLRLFGWRSDIVNKTKRAAHLLERPHSANSP